MDTMDHFARLDGDDGNPPEKGNKRVLKIVLKHLYIDKLDVRLF